MLLLTSESFSLTRKPGAYGTAEKKSMKLRMKRWYTLQSNEIRKHIFLKGVYFFLIILATEPLFSIMHTLIFNFYLAEQ